MKVTVIDLDGVAHEKESVDARECVEGLGWTRPEDQPPEPEVPLTKDQIKDRLSELGVVYKKSAGRDALLGLLESQPPQD